MKRFQNQPERSSRFGTGSYTITIFTIFGKWFAKAAGLASESHALKRFGASTSAFYGVIRAGSRRFIDSVHNIKRMVRHLS